LLIRFFFQSRFAVKIHFDATRTIKICVGNIRRNWPFRQKTVRAFFFNQLIVPPNHAVVCGVKITFYAISSEIIGGGVIVAGARKTVAVLYYFELYIPVVNFPLPIAGNGLRIAKRTGKDSCAKQKEGNSCFQYVEPGFIYSPDSK
jgi:hypothetical protein